LRGREWPDLADVPVTVLAGEERRTAMTDAWGEIAFEGVPASALPGLVVEITPN
jgi:hypothetical protein